jgi:hypothetical protein
VDQLTKLVGGIISQNTSPEDRDDNRNKLFKLLAYFKKYEFGQAIFVSSKKVILDYIVKKEKSGLCMRKEMREMISKIKILKN